MQRVVVSRGTGVFLAAIGQPGRLSRAQIGRDEELSWVITERSVREEEEEEEERNQKTAHVQ